MVKVHTKKYSMSFLMREIQTIITLRCHFLRADGKKKISIKQSKGVEQLKLSDAVRAVKWHHPFGQLFAFLYPTS